MKFNDIELPTKIRKAIEKMGFQEMTPIQELTYPIIHSGRDLCALAETGSGKTAACAIPLVQAIDPKLNAIQGLVIVPTRELCIQYVLEISAIAKNTNVVPFAVYGGFDKGIQKAKLKHKVHILVATPGRLIDLLYDGIVSLSHVKCVILDEADELLKLGFIDDSEFIMSCIMNDHQTLLFAATMDPDIQRLTSNYLQNPEFVSLIKERAAPVSIKHCFEYVHPKRKQNEFNAFIKNEKNIRQVIIFCNSRHGVDNLFHKLKKDVKKIQYIHAGLAQDKRTSIIAQFRKEKIQYLIATDVAGRGLDFSNVSHIINWDFPRDWEKYTHRTGRSGRMGREGKALSFVSKSDLPNLKKLIRKNNINPAWIGTNPLQQKNKPAKQRSKKKKRPFKHNPTRANS